MAAAAEFLAVFQRCYDRSDFFSNRPPLPKHTMNRHVVFTSMADPTGSCTDPFPMLTNSVGPPMGGVPRRLSQHVLNTGKIKKCILAL